MPGSLLLAAVRQDIRYRQGGSPLRLSYWAAAGEVQYRPAWACYPCYPCRPPWPLETDDKTQTRSDAWDICQPECETILRIRAKVWISGTPKGPTPRAELWARHTIYCLGRPY